MAEKIWESIIEEAKIAVEREPFLARYFSMAVLRHPNIFESISCYLAEKIENSFLSKSELQMIFLETIEKSEEIQDAVVGDLQAIRERDPASKSYLNPFLNFKGFHALESYRVAHWLWVSNRTDLALMLQSLISQEYGVDIHPGAKIGKRIFIDHATGIVIGETAVVGNDVSILHAVTLGGTGKEVGDRHPKIGNGVLIGAGAKILGNVKIGDGVKIGAGSVVLSDLPPHTIAVGNPAKVVGKPRASLPSLEMDQGIEE